MFQLFSVNMMIRALRFNTYLLLTVVALGLGCKTMGKKEASTLRIHLEVNSDGTERNSAVPIGRKEPFLINVERDPFLNEGAIVRALVVEGIGGFQIMVHYDRKGTWLLEQYSTAYKGKRIAILSQFGEARWIAAPLLTKRIIDGTLIFTPDTTREEADRIVRGLNAIAKEMHSDKD